jgi:hypothetical protein
MNTNLGVQVFLPEILLRREIFLKATHNLQEYCKYWKESVTTAGWTWNKDIYWSLSIGKGRVEDTRPGQMDQIMRILFMCSFAEMLRKNSNWHNIVNIDLHANQIFVNWT